VTAAASRPGTSGPAIRGWRGGGRGGSGGNGARAAVVVAAFLLDYVPPLYSDPNDDLRYRAVLAAVVACPYALMSLLLQKRPWAACALMSLLATTIPVAPHVRFLPGLFLALYVAASRWPAPQARVALLICAAPILARNILAGRLDTLGGGVRNLDIVSFSVAGDVLLFVPLTGAVYAWARLSNAGELRRREAERLHELVLAQSVQAERLRLARDLHDGIGHALSAIILQAAGARTLMPDGDDQVRRSLGLIQDTGVIAMQDLHGMLGLLRASVDDAGAPPGEHAEGLRVLLDVARASGLEVAHAEHGPPRPLAGDAAQAAYRVVQESLTNARKHAGHGARVQVEERWEQDRLVVIVGSAPARHPGGEHGGPNGVDLAAFSAGTGLAGLSDRVAAAGGRLVTEALAGGGFLVTATLPLPPMGRSRPPKERAAWPSP
jgi:signal transduction histidine kinase